MDIDTAIQTLNTALYSQKPSAFSSTWVYKNTPSVYRFICKHIRTELNEIDWDTVTSKLDRPLQKFWHPRKIQKNDVYKNSNEVQIALGEYWDKRHVFLYAPTVVEWKQRDYISAVLARLAQRGNQYATEELQELLGFMIEKWMEHKPTIARWKGYPDDLKRTIEQCIRCYRYSGSFTTYLRITLIKAGRGLRYVRCSSLDSTLLDTDLKRIDRITQNMETGEIHMMPLNAYHTLSSESFL